ncbi:hypothetical protein KKC60_05470 [Patescibacteria group bacterium]|nr:hypothetical protein [Patescibacteria group bacterium]
MEQNTCPFTYQEDHEAEAVAIFCMDHRFQKATHHFIEDGLGIKHYDRVTIAGAGKSLLEPKDDPDYQVLEKQIDLSAHLHKIKKVLIVHHADCGAYGGKKSFGNSDVEEQKHLDDMEAIKQKVLGIIPGVEVIKIYMALTEDKKKIKPQIVS